jgi:hypothetical protein
VFEAVAALEGDVGAEVISREELLHVHGGDPGLFATLDVNADEHISYNEWAEWLSETHLRQNKEGGNAGDRPRSGTPPPPDFIPGDRWLEGLLQAFTRRLHLPYLAVNTSDADPDADRLQVVQAESNSDLGEEEAATAAVRLLSAVVAANQTLMEAKGHVAATHAKLHHASERLHTLEKSQTRGLEHEAHVREAHAALTAAEAAIKHYPHAHPHPQPVSEAVVADSEAVAAEANVTVQESKLAEQEGQLSQLVDSKERAEMQARVAQHTELLLKSRELAEVSLAKVTPSGAHSHRIGEVKAREAAMMHRCAAVRNQRVMVETMPAGETKDSAESALRTEEAAVKSKMAECASLRAKAEEERAAPETSTPNPDPNCDG